MRPRSLWFSSISLSLTLSACAALAGVAPIIQPPEFQVAGDRQAELRLVGPDIGRPLGGASLRLWARVHNPNRFGVTLRTLDGTLFLEEQQAALVDFPLGLPMLAAQDTVIPLDISLSFADVPRLATLLRQAIDRTEAGFRLDGRVQLDAGILGQPVFGPTTWLSGTVPIRR